MRVASVMGYLAVTSEGDRGLGGAGTVEQAWPRAAKSFSRVPCTFH